jgi:hypothetical protein
MALNGRMTEVMKGRFKVLNILHRVLNTPQNVRHKSANFFVYGSSAKKAPESTLSGAFKRSVVTHRESGV